jgi:hypothetical protein
LEVPENDSTAEEAVQSDELEPLESVVSSVWWPSRLDNV